MWVSSSIVRSVSVPRADTGHVDRARRRRAKHSEHRTTTPVPVSELIASAAEVRSLLKELAELTGCENAWGLRVLRRNVELALLSPETLEGPENQIDFIEELAEAVWDGADSGFRYAVRPAPTADSTHAREERRRAIVERFDHLTDRLCSQVEVWQARQAAATEERLGEHHIPQLEHSV